MAKLMQTYLKIFWTCQSYQSLHIDGCFIKELDWFDELTCLLPLKPNTNDKIMDKTAYGWHSTEMGEVKISNPFRTPHCSIYAADVKLLLERSALPTGTACDGISN
jgi:hypothetical protein